MSLLSDEKILEIARKLAYMDNLTFARAIEAAVLEAHGKQEPVAWLARGIHGGKVIAAKLHDYKQDADNTASVFIEHYGAAETVPLYAAPVVQPDMVMVPREPTEAMLDAAMNRYKNVSPEARLRFFQMHRENFRCDYKAMIAAAAQETSPK